MIILLIRCRNETLAAAYRNMGGARILAIENVLKLAQAAAVRK
ncbi:hypothetical protein [Desulfovibrio sp. UIB00]|nr:hypothetical protein [Desulfovibrio sp. UIB00]